MDPELSLLLLCPLGGLSQEQVAVELSPAHDRRPLPGGDKTITVIWETRLQAQPWIFDALSFCLHSATLVSSLPEPTAAPAPGSNFLAGLPGHQLVQLSFPAVTAGSCRLG